MKKAEGITLVALVVTIIVLIILAGVSINLVLGENGIITKAKLAKEKTEQAEVNEETSINELVENMEETITPTIYVVTFNGTNVTSNGANTINKKATYRAALTLENGYEITSITITMGEKTLIENTDYTYINETIEIPNVLGNIEIKVETKAKEYTIAYDANGGSNPPEEQIKNFGTDIILTNQIPKREGYSFKNWNTLSDGTGEVFTMGATYSYNKDVTLYAQWNESVAKTYSAGSTSAAISEIYRPAIHKTLEIIKFGECNIIPTKFVCNFRCGNSAAKETSKATFKVQGYTNGGWETIITKTATRPTYTGTYTIYSGTYKYNTSKVYTDFRVLFSSTDNERLIYASIRIY